MINNRVAWVLCSNRWNSAITEYALSTARALKLQGWQVYFSALADSPGERRAREYGLVGASFKSFGLMEGLQLRRLAKSIKPQAILLFGGPETFLARLLPGSLRLRFRGQDKDLTDRLSAWRNRLNQSHCRGLLLPALLVQKRFAAILNKPLRTVYLGLDEDTFRFRPQALAEVQRPTLRIIGRLDPIKGHHSLFAMLELLLEQWPASRPKPFLEVIGQPANISAAQLRLMAEQHMLKEGEDWSFCAERIAELGPVLSATHLGVITSLGSEVICRVAEEFLLCGTPIFVSGVGALQETLIDRNFGSSYLGRSEEEAAEVLAESLWQAFQETEKLRQERAQKAKTMFSLRSMGQALDQYLLELDSGKGRSSFR